MIRYYSMGAAAFVAALMGFLGWLVWADRSGGDRFVQCRETAIAGGSGSVGGPFELVDQTGATVTEAEVFAEPGLLYFGYTFCPDVCPLDVDRNALVAEMVEDAGHDLRPVFVSVDPARDTPEVLAEYTAVFHPRMIGLTGTEEQIRQATRAYRAFYNVHPADDDFYLVDHSTFSYLVLPEHGFVEVFRRDIRAPDMAERVTCFLDRA